MDKGVSIVITTTARPKVLERAIKSVLHQTYDDYEIIVVIDGKHSSTINFLEEEFPEIRKIVNTINQGGSESRNIGARAAKKKYVAFLDDDDEWLPTKLELQVEQLEKSKETAVSFTSMYTYIKNKSNKFIIPRKKYEVGQNIGNYIFELKNGKRQGFFQTSTILVPRELILEIPFKKDLPKHQDWNWILDIYEKKIPILHLEIPLSIYHKDMNTKGISKKVLWRYSHSWINHWENFVSADAYQGFLLHVIEQGVAKDTSLTILKRIKIGAEFDKKISAKNIFSLNYIKYKIQFFYLIIKNLS